MAADDAVVDCGTDETKNCGPAEVVSYNNAQLSSIL